MTNEAIAMSIKDGHNELYGELWDQTCGVIVKYAISFYNRRIDYCNAAGITTDDLIQYGFFALRKAVEAYDPAKGYKLLTYIKFPLLNTWNGILRSGDAYAHAAVSLEDRISPDADKNGVMLETISDPVAAEAMEQVIDDEMLRELSEAIDTALDTLPDQLRQVIRSHYWERNSFKEIGDKMGIKPAKARALNSKALDKLRDQGRKMLYPFAEELIETYAYQGNSRSAFIRNQASGVERAYELAEMNRQRIIESF